MSISGTSELTPYGKEFFSQSLSEYSIDDLNYRLDVIGEELASCLCLWNMPTSYLPDVGLRWSSAALTAIVVQNSLLLTDASRAMLQHPRC